jgi:hypothetical protein
MENCSTLQDDRVDIKNAKNGAKTTKIRLIEGVGTKL